MSVASALHLHVAVVTCQAFPDVHLVLLLAVLLQWFGGCMFFLSKTRATIKDSLFLNGAASTAGMSL
jgi:hypothetical protein